jgi:hypothetical protein
MNTYFCDVQGIKKEKTNFYTDIKSPIMAGMQFCYTKGETKNNKIKQVGYNVVRLYYDSKLKDCLLGHEKLKTIFND